ncbi:Uma2 family endonuclease [Methylomonas sp. MgM2]
MKTNTAVNFLSEADYLAGERDGRFRHELIGGQAYAMTGASDKHNKICGNLFAELRNAFKQKNSPCTAYVNDMKVKVQQDFFYPDVMVVCDSQDKENDYYKTRPILIVEVLSSSTHRIDKTVKRQAYQSLESLQVYALVEQDRAEIEVFSRQNDWRSDYFYLGDTVAFQAIDVMVSVEDIYYQIESEDVLAYLKAKAEA